MPAVDYFLSSELIETPESGGQYTEQLWRSKTLFVNVGRLPAVASLPPSHFGLPEGHHLYVCPQNPLKLHPDVDSLFARSWLRTPRASFLAARKGHASELLRHRFARRIPAAADRVVFLPWQTIEDYYRLLQLADVILDPPHYGAGSSCYDIFSFNLPVVTMPGELIVGRVTQACYRKMDVTDLIVASAERVREQGRAGGDGPRLPQVRDRPPRPGQRRAV